MYALFHSFTLSSCTTGFQTVGRVAVVGHKHQFGGARTEMSVLFFPTFYIEIELTLQFYFIYMGREAL